jgi:hypothetical protein
MTLGIVQAFLFAVKEVLCLMTMIPTLQLLYEVKESSEREEIDPVFKDVLIFYFGQFNILPQTQVEVSRLPRTMDALVIVEQSDYLSKIRLETPFGYFRVYNQVEFKGKNDRLTIFGYHLILGRAHLYLGEKKISASEMTVTIISARKPIKVLRHCQNDVRWETVGVGHYVNTDLLPVHLIVTNELPIEPKNYLLLLFTTSKKKFRQFLKQIVKEDNSAYLYYAYRIDPKLTKEVLEMSGKSRSYRKNLEFIAKDIGEELIPFLSKEDMLKHLTPKDIMRALSPEDIVRVLTPEELVRNLTPEERLIGLAPEERKKLRQLLEDENEKNQR